MTILECLKDKFIGRSDCYMIQRDDGSYYQVKDKLIDVVIERCLSGKMTISTYVICNNKCKFVVFDIDEDKVENVRKILEILTKLHIKAIPEFSGFKGYHIWVLLSDWVDVDKCYDFGLAISNLTGFISNKEFEFFPKQRHINNGSYGYGVKMPLQVHRVTGKLACFLDNELQEIKEIEQFMNNLDSYVNDIEYFIKITESLKQRGYAKNFKTSIDMVEVNLRKKPYKGKINLEKICINNLLAGVCRGQRDESAVRIASALKLAGLDYQSVLNEMLLWNERNQPPLTIREIEAKVESVFNHEYMFGCNDFLLKQYCDRNCKLNKNKEVNLEVSFALNGFINGYLDYIEDMEIGTPYEFNVFVALTVLSTVINKKIKLPFGNSYIMPNMWTVLVAPSSFMKKNVSINIGVQLLRKYNQSLFLSRVFTQEGLLDQLNSTPSGLIVFDEFGSFLSSTDKVYMSGVKETLTDLFDYHAVYTKRLAKAEYNIPEPCISMLSASTLDWLVEKLKDSDLRGGFLPRFVFVNLTVRDFKFPDIIFPRVPDGKLEADLLDKLMRIGAITGNMCFSNQAKVVIGDWWKGLSKVLATFFDKELALSFFQRLLVYAWKLCLILQVSEEGTLEISEITAKKTVKILNFLIESVREIIQEDFSPTEIIKKKNKLLRLIKSNPGITHSDLLRNSHLLKMQFAQIIETLTEERSIYYREESSEGGRIVKKYYPWQ